MRSVLGLLLAGVLLFVAFGTGAPGDDRADRLDELRENGERVAGTVTKLEEVERTRRTGGRRSRRTETYTEMCPKVAYRVDGMRLVLVDRHDCDRLQVGDEVTVLHAPGAPYDAMIDSDQPRQEADSGKRTTWILAGGGVIIGLGSLLGLVMRISNWRHRRANAAGA